MKRILALCGGGSAGYASAKYLQAMESAFGPIHEIFDLVAGVSTGSIIAAAAGKGMSMNDVAALYKDHLPAIFHRSKWKFWRGMLGGSKYSSKTLEQVLRDTLPGAFGDLDACRVMIHATMVDPQVRPKHWKSFEDVETMPAADAVLASCCAPTYFPPHSIAGQVFVDGGLTANNPASMALAEGLSMGWDMDDIRVLCVQPMSNYGRVPHAAERKSALQWAPVLPAVFLGTDQKSVDYECRELLDTRYMNVNLMVNSAMDDVSKVALEDMAIDANRAWADSQDCVRVMLGL